MIKRALSLFLVLCMVLTMMPTAIFAEDGLVAQIGSNNYVNLQDAVDAVADGDTIQLLKDTALTETVNIASDINFTLDLNGKTLNGGNKIAIKHEGSGTLTIKDTVGNGKITSSSSSRTIEKKDGQLKVENTLLENTSSVGAVISAYGSEIFISNSEVKSSSKGINLSINAINSKSSNVYLSNTNVESKNEAINYFVGGAGNISITGGTIENTDTSVYTIYNQGTGKISIPGGSVVIKAGGKAMNKAPDLSGYTNVKITASTTATDGSATSEINKTDIDTDAGSTNTLSLSKELPYPMLRTMSRQ